MGWSAFAGLVFLFAVLLKALYVARVDGGVQVIGEHFIQIVNADQGGHIAEFVAAADRKFQFNQRTQVDIPSARPMVSVAAGFG